MCVKTLSAWKIGKKPNGKDLITFTAPGGGKGEFLQLPCYQCIECRLERSRQWAVRCMHEASLSEDNCFITLTFNDDHLDPQFSLQKTHFQKFMKRLRKHLSEAVRQAPRVRYFHAGEYGDNCLDCQLSPELCRCLNYKPGRPHHHAILFGIDFPDKIFKVERNGFRYYESPLLTKLWSDPITKESYGFHEITDVTFETCAYVARYVCKKINGEPADDHYSYHDEQGNFYKRKPEFCTMSRRPGIGLGWYDKYKDSDVFAHDSIIVRGNVKCKPPRYYGSKYELSNPLEYAILKDKRLQHAKQNPDSTFERQAVRAVVKKAQSKMLKRKL